MDAQSHSTNASANTSRSSSTHRQAPASLTSIPDATTDHQVRTTPTTPSWPVSPRLKSPASSGSRAPSVKNDDPDYALSATIRRLTPISSSVPTPTVTATAPEDGKNVPMRVPTRGGTGLETVQEGSSPNTPSIEPRPNPVDKSELDRSTETVRSDILMLPDPQQRDGRVEPPTAGKSSKVDAENKSQTPRTVSGLAKRSFSSLTGSRRPPTEPVRVMTVETETVIVPQIMDRNRDTGSVRARNSEETIRAKKEKKKRKTGSLHAGVNATKADIFESKVSHAMDEADSTDSDETFVYESNPRDLEYRHHSRTPSATSTASTIDHRGGRSRQNTRSGSSSVVAKKSMKFTNSSFRGPNTDAQDSSGRGSRNNSATPRHHHISRHHRVPHNSLFDAESPFTRSPRPSSGGELSRNPNSPRMDASRSQGYRSPRRYNGQFFDLNAGVADDESTPLMGTMRINRDRRKQQGSRDLRLVAYGDEQRHERWQRCGCCSVMLGFMLTVALVLSTLLYVVNKPLQHVEVLRIKNVLASEQELILDLEVHAVNPNLFPITVHDLSIDLFAESPYAGTSSEWEREHTRVRIPMADRRSRYKLRTKRASWSPRHNDHGIDEGTDPIDDEPGVQKLLLGRVMDLDTPLAFEPDPWRRRFQSSLGELRLARPANTTETGGSARWERVLQHDFDLIVRGVVRYQLPLSSRASTAKVAGRKTIHPDSEDTGDADNTTTTWR